MEESKEKKKRKNFLEMQIFDPRSYKGLGPSRKVQSIFFLNLFHHHYASWRIFSSSQLVKLVSMANVVGKSVVCEKKWLRLMQLSYKDANGALRTWESVEVSVLLFFFHSI